MVALLALFMVDALKFPCLFSDFFSLENRPNDADVKVFVKGYPSIASTSDPCKWSLCRFGRYMFLASVCVLFTSRTSTLS